LGVWATGVRYAYSHASTLLCTEGGSQDRELPIHLQEGLAEGAAQRLRLEQFPSYVPDLNPQEGVWHYLKNVEMKNLCCRSLKQLKTELRRAKERFDTRTRSFKALPGKSPLFRYFPTRR